MERTRLTRAAGISLAVVAVAALSPGPSSSATSPPPSRTDVLELPRVLPRRTLHVPILMYHRIARHRPGMPAITRRLTVDPRVFAAQMAWLNRNGFRTITQRELFDALLHGRRLGPRPVLVTFDDGYQNVLLNASGVIERYGMRATAYVITSRISHDDSVFLRWGQLRVLEQRGIEIGSHSVTHRDLSTLPDAALRAELARSRKTLERALGHPIQSLAYPFGSFDARVLRVARQAGYVLAVTTRGGFEQSAGAPLELRRLSVVDTTGVGGLASMLGSRLFTTPRKP